jgi:hypothetical protein
MHLKILPSHAGNSTSQGMPIDNHFTHHRGHHQDAPQEVEEEEVMEVGEAMTVEVEYPCHMEDQACSHHMDELPTLTSSSVANLSLSQGIE